MSKRILWVDDEIDLLRAHTRLLEQKGYNVDTASNGEDAVELVQRNEYGLVFLDEIMPGMGGLETLAKIKEYAPNLPVIMVTKNEAESLMEEAIGSNISDYLTKPVNPSQILLTFKKFIEAKKITEEYVSRDYTQELQQINLALMKPLDYREWTDLYLKITDWDIQLDEHPELGLRQTLLDQKRECNVEFAKFVERNYIDWINNTGDRPVLSTEVVEKFVVPELESTSNIFFFVIDCMRLDQWLMMERYLTEYFSIEKEYYYSILPTATPYARNALFSGLFPIDIESRFPELWQTSEDD